MKVRSLYGFAIRQKMLYAVSSNSSCKLLLVSLLPYDSRKCKIFLVIFEYIPRIISLSASASSLVAYTVCPSFQRNSLLLRNGVGCLNSHLITLFHWLNFNGRSLHDRIHFENDSYIMVSEVGLMASLSSSFVLPASVTHATSGAKPSTCSCSFLRSLSGMSRGK